MAEKISTIIGKMRLCVVVLIVPLAVYPQNKPLIIGVRGGLAVPQHWTLQGWHTSSDIPLRSRF